MFKRASLVVIFALAVCAMPSRAEDPATEENSMMGPEFNFRSPLHWGALAANLPLAPLGWMLGGDDIGARLTSHMLIEQMYRIHDRMCRQSKNCRVERTKTKGLKEWVIEGGYKVIYNDGYWFQFTKDPYVVEIRSKAMSYSAYEKVADRVQRDLFDVAESVGLRAATTVSNSSAGHLNFGVKQTFGNDAKLFRNFVVDFANHSELSSGILRDSGHNNALVADKARFERFQAVIARFDRGEITTIKGLVDAINKDVYLGVAKYNALSFLSFVENPDNPEKWRVEIRAVRAQRNMAEYMAQCKLILARVRHLNRQGGLVPVAPYAPPRKDEVEGATEFRKYVVEAGEPWEAHRAFLQRRYQRVEFDESGVGRMPARSFVARCQDAWGRFTGF